MACTKQEAVTLAFEADEFSHNGRQVFAFTLDELCRLIDAVKSGRQSTYRRSINKEAKNYDFLADSDLTVTQTKLLMQVNPFVRNEIKNYLKQGAEVVIYKQNDAGPDVPPFAIAIKDRQDFWIDCCDTVDLAIKKAVDLGLKVCFSEIDNDL